jgi:hypothetical protein
MKRCSFCDAELYDAAIDCKHCGRGLPAAELLAIPPVLPTLPEPLASWKVPPALTAAIFLVLFVGLALAFWPR